MEKRCCCGKCKLEDGEPFIANDILHGVLGPEDNFCGKVVDHCLRDCNKKVAKLQEACDLLERIAINEVWCSGTECPDCEDQCENWLLLSKAKAILFEL